MKSVRYWLAAAALLCIAGFFALQPALRYAVPEDHDSAGGLSLRVDLSDRVLSVIQDGEVTGSYRVAVGKPSYPTPRGSFHIHRIIWNPRWVPPDSPWARKKTAKEPGDPDNPMGSVKIFFSEPDYYIHGTREVDSLGEAESHGCIRMRNGQVIALAREVMAAGGKPVRQGWIRRMINKVRSTREVRLSEPVPITITG